MLQSLVSKKLLETRKDLRHHPHSYPRDDPEMGSLGRMEYKKYNLHFLNWCHHHSTARGGG